MTHELFDAVELGQAETLIELGWGQHEELQDKFDSATSAYVEF